jgi:hypothetical protein
MTFLKRLIAALVLVGTLAGLLAYQRWLLAAIFAVAVLYAGAPRLIQLAVRIQNYPKLLQQVVGLRERVEELEESNEELGHNATAQFKAGIDEGVARVRGTLLAALADAPPDLRAITERQGALVLVGHYDEKAPGEGARYDVQDIYTGERKGVVEVGVVDEERRLVFMSCVEPTAPLFWQHLEARVAADTTPPANVVLAPAPVDYVSPMLLEEPDAPAERGEEGE